jgi:CRP-like cAMP-binding protein
MVQEPNPETLECATRASGAFARPTEAHVTIAETFRDHAYALGETACLHTLSPQLLRLRGLPVETVSFAPGDVIFREGERGDAAFVLLAGRVEIVVGGPNGPLRVAELGSAASIGECSLFSDGPRWATARALSQVNALRLSREAFERLVMEYPSVGLGIIRTLGRRLQRAIGYLRTKPGRASRAPAAGPCRAAPASSISEASSL